MPDRPSHLQSIISVPTTEQQLANKAIKPTKRPLSQSEDFVSAAIALADQTNLELGHKRARISPKLETSYNDSSFVPAPDLLGNEYTSSQTATQKPFWPKPYSENDPLPPSTTQIPGAAELRKTTNTRSLWHKKWRLPAQVIHGYAECGIKEMYPWQEECLSLPGLLEGETNVVYTAPTSSGKSLVADILMIKKVLATRQKAIVIVPYVSIVQEKTRFLKKALGKVQMEFPGIEGAQGFMGKSRRRPLNIVGYHSGTRNRMRWKDLDIAICTTEKANAMINVAAVDHELNQLGLVIFDELHMLDDEHRGFIIELLATKLLCLDQLIQIIGMSATLANVDVMAKWLRAHFYNCTFRPIPLAEHIVFKDEIQTYDGWVVGRIEPSSDKRLKDPFTNALVSLSCRPVREGHGVLVFCESKFKCEHLAQLISDFTPTVDDLPQKTVDQRYDLLRELATGVMGTGVDPTLEKTIPRGVAFHHAGITTEERDLIAKAYEEGVVKLICCTPTMAAGVNLPARRVVIYPKTGREYASPAMIRQMRGRAGRAGRDTFGETFVLTREKEFKEIKALLEAELPSVSSCLANENGAHGLSRALLEVIATCLANSPFSIDAYFRSTLLYYLHPTPPELPALLTVTLTTLSTQNLITEETSGHWVPTQLGTATVASGLSPTDGVFLSTELTNALQNFNLSTDLQITYQLTPIHGTNTPHDLRNMRWDLIRDTLESFDDADLKTATFITINPGLVNKMARIGGHLDESTPTLHATARTHRRFYLSLILRDLIHEIPLAVIARKFSAPRGSIQQLATTSKGFAATSATFCRVMGWTGLAVLLEHYAERLNLGVRDELVQLAKLPFVKSVTARAMWEHGLKGVGDVAAASVERVAEVLMAVVPKRRGVGEREVERVRERCREKAEVVVAAAGRLWEAECLVELDE
ncbi:P-loop containing nucleoside triphosphate hydrolase protein [Ascodesmis nigricans]|uniref:P-loop containing nucleoside triphosphate hydrolase protein n=1 Tax=Ascodesmis nigricans TaxID=341454 RepID=A0A4S2N2Y0_9PEZI|nr:P-loop containing nucleoside triphosphate hydrolase protein [Ascodesmis nigricans]